jgi:hypothetical protein
MDSPCSLLVGRQTSGSLELTTRRTGNDEALEDVIGKVAHEQRRQFHRAYSPECCTSVAASQQGQVVAVFCVLMLHLRRESPNKYKG